MKLSLSSVFLLVFSFAFSTSSYGRADSSTTDKRRFILQGGVGAYSSDWVMSIVYFNAKEAVTQPNLIYSGSLQYWIGKDIGLSICGFYSKGTYNSTVGSVYDPLDINDQIPHIQTKYHTTYSVIGGAAECQVIYDRIHNTSKVLYCSGGVGYEFGKGTKDSVIAFYPPGSHTASYYPGTMHKAKDIVKVHITLVGLRGGKNLCWYAELGYGYKGILNAGLALKL